MQPLSFVQIVKASPSAVFRAFTRPIALREWLCDGAVAEARPGGHYHFWWNSGYYASGEFTMVEQDKAAAFTWQGRHEPAATQVAVSLAPAAAGVQITLTHSGLAAGPEWAAAAQEISRGWEVGLENLVSVLETGLDLRFVRRPVLGVNLDEFNADIAARMGVPVTEGVRLSGVVGGLGAQAAGLQSDDVIVAIGGAAINDWPTLVTALQRQRAGDRVLVVFWRGSEKRTVEMTLSARSLPEVPAAADALAAALQGIYDEFGEEVARCFEGVSDARAAHKPAANEWSALDAVAHLIATERENLVWIADVINDAERWPDRFENPTNVPARIAGTVAAYPTVAAMLDELKRNQTEATATIAALPAEVVARKGTYWRLGRDLLLASEHIREHIGQIRAAIQMAPAQ
jgi:uncharacterized protein YndB with AHSA1/START domain